MKKLNLIELENLDDFYHPIHAKKGYVARPFFHGTRRAAIECDPTFIEEIHKHSDIILSTFARYLNSKKISDEEYQTFDDYNYEHHFQYFGCYTIQMYGERKNFQYGDYYATVDIDRAMSYMSNVFGELYQLAYENACGLRDLKYDLGINESIDFIINAYDKIGHSDKVLLVTYKIKSSDIRDESGYSLNKEELLIELNHGSFRIDNIEQYPVYVIGEQLFEDAEKVFNPKEREVYFRPLNEEKVAMAKSWLYDILVWGGLIANKRRGKYYQFMFNAPSNTRKTTGTDAAKTICQFILEPKVDYESFKKIDDCLEILTKYTFGKTITSSHYDTVWCKPNQLAKFLSFYCILKNIISCENEQILNDLETLKRNTIFGKALWFDLHYKIDNNQ